MAEWSKGGGGGGGEGGVACGLNSFDLFFPLSCSYLTMQPMRNIYFLKALLMKNTLKIEEVPSQQDVRF